MAKLTSAQRKNLPDDQFGLPEEKAFPMPDEAHVRSAIAYFHTCPPDKRKELAANINRIAKSYNMKIKLKKHSAFAPYADKDIIAEESLNVIDFPHITMEEIRYIRKFENQKKDDFSKFVDNAMHKITECFLDKEYLTNGRIGCSKLSDFMYDKDLDMCYKLTNKISCTSDINSGVIFKSIRKIRNNYLLSNMYSEVKKILDLDIVDKFVDELEAILIDNDSFIRSIDELDDYIKSDIYNPDKWDSYGLSKQFLTNDMIFKSSNFKNFSEYEIYLIEKNRKPLKHLCAAITRYLYKKCGYPVMNNRHNIFLDVEEMYNRKIIDGFYTCENANGYENLDFNTVIKIKSEIYVPIHTFRTKKECIITMAKIYDLKNENYYYEMMDKWIRGRSIKIPKIPVKRITFKKHGIPLEKTFEGINIDYDGEVYFV